uniref:Periostin, osteoblast specific factor a n=1 Tax=Oryzias sinensis TaxID=183150 RepID=A0A8C8DR94_9TELE
MDKLLVVNLFVLVLCSVGRVNSSAYDKIVTHSRIRARKEGPNVCALQQVMGSSKKYFSTCRNWHKGSICGKKAVVLYECCPGYMKIEGMKGCPAAAPIDDVYGTLGLVKATVTQQYINESQLRGDIEGPTSVTLFAPSNDAWDLLDPNEKLKLAENENQELYNTLLFHTVNQRLVTKDMKNGLVVPTMSEDHNLYINHYGNGVVTVNCARIIYGNQVATNGAVHVIDRVIRPVSGKIKDILEENENLSSFTTAASAADLLDKLGEAGHYTLFVPTDEAFDKLPSGYLERIIENNAVITALVKYHLLNSVQCAEAIMAGSVYETEEGSSIEIGCDGDFLTVNGIKMVLKKDIVTSNGVIHLIDQVLFPDSAKEITELMGESQSYFRDYFSEMDFASAMRPNLEYTLLAPLNGVFTEEVSSIAKSELKLLLENHILKVKVSLSELYTGQQLETLSGKFLRAFIYRTAVCLENACMVRGSKEGKNGALHLVGSLVKTSDKTLYKVLKDEGQFKIFLSLMETAGLYDMLKEEGAYTIFAPTDDAFKELTSEDLTLLKSDVTALKNILLYHISNGIFISGGLERGVTNMLKTMQGLNLPVKFVNNSVNVNSVDVPDTDLMATNGVVHVVKNVLYPPGLPVGREDLWVLLQKLIKYIKIKFVSGYSYSEIQSIASKISLCIDVKSTEVKYKEVVKAEPSLTKITRYVEKDPTISKVVRVIDRQPINKVTRVISGTGAGRKVSEGLTVTGETNGTLAFEPQIIEGPDVSKILSIRDNPSLLKSETSRLTQLIKGGGQFSAARKAPVSLYFL